jgi:hypothetical protein
VALESRRYTDQELADMARRLDECIEVSALCMDLALAGELHRAKLAAERGEPAPPVLEPQQDRDWRFRL